MEVKWNVYWSLSPTGPWTKHNPTPLANNPVGNSYTLTGLTSGVEYFIIVVGGKLDEDGEFVPLMSQAIGPVSEDGSTIRGKPIAAKPL